MPFDIFFWNLIIKTKFVYQNDYQNLLFQRRAALIKIAVYANADVARVAIQDVRPSLTFVPCAIYYVAVNEIVVRYAATPFATVFMVSVNFIKRYGAADAVVMYGYEPRHGGLVCRCETHTNIFITLFKHNHRRRP